MRKYEAYIVGSYSWKALQQDTNIMLLSSVEEDAGHMKYALPVLIH